MIFPSSTFSAANRVVGAVALVVVGHGPGTPLLQRQARLGTVQRLDLGLLIHAQNHGMRRRLDIQAHDVADLLGEAWVVGELEGAKPVRRLAVGAPDALNRGEADRRRLGHQPARLQCVVSPGGGLSVSFTICGRPLQRKRRLKSF